MKKVSFALAIVITAFGACDIKTESGQPTGTYVNNSKSEYSLAFDTLIVTPLNKSDNNYQIERKTGYQKIRGGILKPKEYKVEKWQSSWDETKQTLSETELGRQMSLSQDGKVLTLKTTQYQRIKQ